MSDFDHLRAWDPLDHVPVENAVRNSLRDLTVNLMRVSRGAGKSYEIVRQMGACAKAFGRYAEEKEHFPSAFDLDSMLDFRRADAPTDPRDRIEASIVTMIVRASIRIAAAELEGNSLQRQAGERDLYEAIRTFNDERARR